VLSGIKTTTVHGNWIIRRQSMYL